MLRGCYSLTCLLVSTAFISHTVVSRADAGRLGTGRPSQSCKRTVSPSIIHHLSFSTFDFINPQSSVYDSILYCGLLLDCCIIERMPRRGRARKKTRTHVVENDHAASALSSQDESKIPRSVVVRQEYMFWSLFRLTYFPAV